MHIHMHIYHYYIYVYIYISIVCVCLYTLTAVPMLHSESARGNAVARRWEVPAGLGFDPLLDSSPNI